jgi:isopentenyl phosphate kinase
MIKFGGSLITDKGGARQARLDVIDRLAKELATAMASGVGPVLLGHGSGSFGHPAAAANNLAAGRAKSGDPAGVSATHLAARNLHRIVLDSLERSDLRPFSLPPAAWMVASQGVIRVLTLDPLFRALDQGLLPVLFGDVLLAEDQGASIGSTEAVLLATAAALQEAGRSPSRAIWLGNTAGVLDADGRLIESLDPQRWSEVEVRETGVTDVTGGIRLRVETTFSLARRGVPSLVTDGTVPGYLLNALTDAPCPGTRIAAVRLE